MTPVLRKIARRSGSRSRSALGVQATAEDTLAALRDVHAAGEPVPVTALPTGLYEAVLQHFGSIAVARARLGIAPPDRARVWSRKKVLAKLRRLFRAGVDLTATNLRRHRGLLGAIRNHVGGLREARDDHPGVGSARDRQARARVGMGRRPRARGAGLTHV